MRFEDYNYRMYNELILVDHQNAAANKFLHSGSSKLMDQGPKLTESNINASIVENYEFDQIGPLEEDKDGDEYQEAVKADGNAVPGATPLIAPEAEEAADESQDQDPNESDGEDMLLYYDPMEIESVKDQQQYDVFQELLEQRRDAVFAFVNTTKITIMDLAPKESELNKNLNSKSKRAKRSGKSMKSSMTGDHAEDFKMNDEEADQAMQIEMHKQKQSDEIIIKQSELINEELQAQIQQMLIASG